MPTPKTEAGTAATSLPTRAKPAEEDRTVAERLTGCTLRELIDGTFLASATLWPALIANEITHGGLGWRPLQLDGMELLGAGTMLVGTLISGAMAVQDNRRARRQTTMRAQAQGTAPPGPQGPPPPSQGG